MGEIKNLKEAAERVQKAVDSKEPVILYGDSDMDGVTSVIQLKEALASIGGNVVQVYFPDREVQGYGINETALKELKQYAPALLIVMDMGIGNIEETKKAKKAGFDVLIVDHHEVLGGKIPDALVVDPKQEGDEYPFKTLAACGLVFRLVEKLLGSRTTPALRNALVELAALGTIADMMPQEQDNEEITEEGLGVLRDSWRPGIQAFWEFEPVASLETLRERVNLMIAILNVRNVENGLPGAYRLLTARTKEEAAELINLLWERHKERQEELQAIVDAAEFSFQGKRNIPVLFFGQEGVEYVLLGGAASALVRKYGKPVFLYKLGDKESIGSARAPQGYNTVQAMEACKDLLITYGGHPPASGFRLETKNLEKFRRHLEDYFETHK